MWTWTWTWTWIWTWTCHEYIFIQFSFKFTFTFTWTWKKTWIWTFPCPFQLAVRAVHQSFQTACLSFNVTSFSFISHLFALYPINFASLRAYHIRFSSIFYNSLRCESSESNLLIAIHLDLFASKITSKRIRGDNTLASPHVKSNFWDCLRTSSSLYRECQRQCLL
jgi:hypothetical protein